MFRTEKGAVQFAVAQAMDQITVHVVEASLPETTPIFNLFLDNHFLLPRFKHERWEDYAALVQDGILSLDFDEIQKELYDRHLMEIVNVERQLDDQIKTSQDRRQQLRVEVDQLSELAFRQTYDVAVSRMQSILTRLGN